MGIAGGGTSASFAYDGLGRRISKTVNSTSTQFVYDGLNPVQELSGGSPVANLLPGLGIDEFISRTEGGTTSTFLTNALGSTIALTDGTGTVQTEYTYDPFGMATVTGTSSTNSFQFTGREHDGTGLLYYRARYYSPVIQRFISEDLIGFAGGDPNLYGYVGNSPINFTDPIGLLVLGLGGSGSGGAWGVLDGAGGVVFDGVNVDSYAYAGGSSGPQFAATSGGTGIVAPFANSIYDIQGPSFDFHIRIAAQLTISVPIDFNLGNTTFAFDTPGFIAIGLGWGIGYTKIGPPGGAGGGPGGPGGDGSGSGGKSG